MRLVCGHGVVAAEAGAGRRLGGAQKRRPPSWGGQEGSGNYTVSLEERSQRRQVPLSLPA